jgi:hypothetical protein
MHQIGANKTPKLFLTAPHCKIFDVKLMAHYEVKHGMSNIKVLGVQSPSIGSSSATNTKRMSVSLSGDAARLLAYLAEAQGITQNEALRKAIATEAYLRQEIEQGAKVLLQKSNKDIREVVFR